jgi:hypothetical protein
VSLQLEELKMADLRKLPWKHFLVVWLVAAPYYTWMFVSIARNRVPPPAELAAGFLANLFVGFFIVKAVFKRLNNDRS